MNGGCSFKDYLNKVRARSKGVKCSAGHFACFSNHFKYPSFPWHWEHCTSGSQAEESLVNFFTLLFHFTWCQKLYSIASHRTLSCLVVKALGYAWELKAPVQFSTVKVHFSKKRRSGAPFSYTVGKNGNVLFLSVPTNV